MKKKLFFAAVALVALASCTNDEFVGVETPQDNSPSVSDAIMFSSVSKGTTRADHVGADAASLLNNKFIVGGFKGATGTSTAYNSDGAITTQGVPAKTTVFDNYIVNWGANTAATTESNSSDWEYAGITAVAPSGIAGNTQSIKYWDYSTDQYDFIAYSTSDATIVTNSDDLADGKVLVSAIDAANAGKTAAYTLKGNTAALQKCYIADMVTVYKDGASLTPAQPKYQDIVKFTFRSLVSKVRIALYETIPGYAIKDVKFYTNATANLNSTTSGDKVDNATLFTTGTNDKDNFYASGEYKVYFPTIGKDNVANSDYNKAHVVFTAGDGGKGTTMDWGALDYQTAPKHKEGDADSKWLARDAANATFAGKTTGEPYYQIVLPNEEGTVLELRVDYSLVSEDGSGETINIYGATAFVPAIYTAWKPNYAYTYLFKISDNTNGWTSNIVDDSGNPTDPAGLYPITFDAIVLETEDNTQSTITTVATPSITTYQKGHVYTDNEYVTKASDGDIYIQVMTDGTLNNDLDTKGKLYTVADRTDMVVSEADVMDALNIRVNATGDPIVGYNGWELTDATTSASVNAEITTIPGADGNNITVTAKTAAKFTPTANTTYAYVYQVSTGTPKTVYIGETLNERPSDWTASGLWYIDENGTTEATAFTPGAIYYKKRYTNLNNVYGVKVIRVQ